MKSNWLFRLSVTIFLMAGCGSAPTSPASSSSGSAGWDDVVAAAKREGRVAVLSQGGADINSALVSAFQQRYPELQVELTGAIGAELVTKVLTERQAARFNYDVIVHGTTTVSGLIKADAIDPILPFLVGPDDRSPAGWLDGAFDFADDAEKFNIVLLSGVQQAVLYNRQVVPAGSITSYKELLDAKWKGKLAMIDPRVPGAGLASATYWYLHKDLGKEYITTLFGQQDVALTVDNNQLIDWVGHAERPVALAFNTSSANDAKKRGIPIEPLADIKEGVYVSSGLGSAAVLNKAPHPNATKVYLNWLFSKEGQELLSKVGGYPSRRQDAVNADLPESTIPKPGVQYLDSAKQSFQTRQSEVIGFLKSVIS